MTISSTTNRISYDGNSVTVAFAVSFPFQAKADLVVLSTVISTGVQTTKALTTDYTISGSTDTLGFYSSGGTVTFLVAPASTVRITIYRDPARTQGLDLVASDSLPAESTEAAIDYQTMLIQRVYDLISRSLRQPDGDSANIDVLPSTVDRASMYLGFDSDGDPIALSAPTGTSITTAFILTLLDDASALTARATLGASEIEPKDGTFKIQGSQDQTKKARFEVDGITASTTRVVTVPDRDLNLGLTHATEVAASSGAVIDFTGIPAGVRRIVVMFNQVSLSGTDVLRVVLGTAGGFVTSSYAGVVDSTAPAVNVWSGGTGIDMTTVGVAAGLYTGMLTLTLMNATLHEWFAEGMLARTDSAILFRTCGHLPLAGAISKLLLTTNVGSNTFDAGTVNIAYEF